MIKEYKSSHKRLVAFFKSSRDKWKERASLYQSEKRSLVFKLRDVTNSRDRWKNDYYRLKVKVENIIEKEKKTKVLLKRILNL